MRSYAETKKTVIDSDMSRGVGGVQFIGMK